MGIFVFFGVFFFFLNKGEKVEGDLGRERVGREEGGTME